MLSFSKIRHHIDAAIWAWIRDSTGAPWMRSTRLD